MYSQPPNYLISKLIMKSKTQVFIALICIAYQSQLFAQIFHQSTMFAVSKSGINSLNTLHQYNEEFNQWNLIGNIGTQNIDAIAFDNVHQILYAANGGILGTLNRSTGKFTAIGVTNYGNGELGRFLLNNIDGLTFCPLSNTLYASHHRLGDYAGSNDLLFKIDPADGKIIPFSMINSKGNMVDYAVIEAVEHNNCCELYGVNDLALNSYTNQLYAIQSNKTDNEILTTIDLSSAETQSIEYNFSNFESKGLTISNFGELFGSSALSDYFLIINTQYQFVQPLCPFDYYEQYQEFHSIAYAGPYNDLALKITLHPDEKPPFFKNDTINCEIMVYNQGQIEVNDIQLINHLPEGLVLNESQWIDQGAHAILNINTQLNPGDSLLEAIQLIVQQNQEGNLMNTTEILSVRNHEMIDPAYNILSLLDIDSTADEVADNETHIVDNETKLRGEKMNEDEDDHDLVIIEISSKESICLAELMLMDNFLNTGIYNAEEVIISNGVIVDSVSVRFKAGDSILLNNNFEVKKGAAFEASIGICE